MLRGFKAVDRRSAAARSVLDWQRRVIAELGGESALSELQRARIATASRTRLLLDHLDSHLVEPASLFAKKGKLRKEVRGVLDLRTRLADQFDRVCAQLGARAGKDGAGLPSIADLVKAAKGRRNGDAD